MEILYVLIPMAILLLALAVVGFMWAVKSGQFDDLEGPAHRILMDDDDPRIPPYRAKEEPPEENRDKERPREEP